MHLTDQVIFCPHFSLIKVFTFCAVWSECRMSWVPLAASARQFLTDTTITIRALSLNLGTKWVLIVAEDLRRRSSLSLLSKWCITHPRAWNDPSNLMLHFLLNPSACTECLLPFWHQWMWWQISHSHGKAITLSLHGTICGYTYINEGVCVCVCTYEIDRFS